MAEDKARWTRCRAAWRELIPDGEGGHLPIGVEGLTATTKSSLSAMQWKFAPRAS